MGGTCEPADKNISHTAAREFVEEGKKIFNINDIHTKLESVPDTYIIQKKHRRINYYFYVVSWDKLSDITPEKFIDTWRKKKIKGDIYNEKTEVALIKHDNIYAMAHTVKMVINKINALLGCDAKLKSENRMDKNNAYYNEYKYNRNNRNKRYDQYYNHRGRSSNRYYGNRYTNTNWTREFDKPWRKWGQDPCTITNHWKMQRCGMDL